MFDSKQRKLRIAFVLNSYVERIRQFKKKTESDGAKDVSFLTILVRKKHPSHHLKPFPA